MRQLALLAALITAIVPSAADAGFVTHPECASILPPSKLLPGRRPLIPEDLARLRDIGPAEPQYFASPFFTLSPDGRFAAFQLRRGDSEHNSYCIAMVVLDLTRRRSATIVDEGTEPILLTIDLHGITDIPNGVMKVITPRWSADGKWIAFLKHEDGVTQVWRAFTDGSGSAPLTHSNDDVVDFRIGRAGSSLIYATRPDLARQRLQNEQEGLSGWHYDDRFSPFISKRPLERPPGARRAEVLDLASGVIREPTLEERALVAQDDAFPSFGGAPQLTGVDGLEISATNLSGGARLGSLHARLANGAIASCNAPPCGGAINPWWMPRKVHVRFRRVEGWANASTAIYDWDTRNGKVRRLYVTDDLLTSCTPNAKFLICLRHSSLVPGRLVRLDPDNGSQETLFELNPEFAHLALGTPRRLHWRNALGIETIADLVLPVGYKSSDRYPLIVVQYDTRGFLRGGTDDEYPIQAFANRGYAVLSFKRPAFVSDQRGAKNYEQAGHLDLEHFADRRSVQSSLEAGVRLAIKLGVADPYRLGITGLSDGASSAVWELIHSSLFRAAAISSCCWDPTLVAQVGPSAARHFMQEGYPGVLERNSPFWKDVSLSDNARRLSVPILINASEEEFLGAILTFTALREARVPVDLFEYPGELHGRWQPAHRLATYRRSIDWFDYWLRGIRSNAPDRQTELENWDRLRQEAGHRIGG